MKTRASGIGMILVIVAIAVCAGIAAAGYLVMARGGDSSGRTGQINTTEKTMDDSQTKSNLRITELGITLPLEGPLADATYIADKADSPDHRSQSAVAYIMSHRFHELYMACDDSYIDGDGPAFAILTRNNGAMPPQAADAGLARQFKDFWISVSYPDGLTCETGDEAQSASIERTRQELQAQLSKALDGASQL